MAKKSIDEIVEEKLPTFANIIKEMKSTEELEKNLIVYLREKEGLVMQKARDERIIKLSKKKTELSRPYTQTISALKKMTECVYKFGHKFEHELRAEFEKNLIGYARQLSHVKAEKDADETLEAVSDALKDCNDEYNPAIKMLELKCEYISFMLKERFGANEPKVEI